MLPGLTAIHRNLFLKIGLTTTLAVFIAAHPAVSAPESGNREAPTGTEQRPGRAPQGNIVIDAQPGSVMFITDIPPAHIEGFRVRVSGPDGRTVFERTAPNDVVEWIPDTRLPEGPFRFHAFVVGHDDAKAGVDTQGQPTAGRSNSDSGARRDTRADTDLTAQQRSSRPSLEQLAERMGTLQAEAGSLTLVRPPQDGRKIPDTFVGKRSSNGATTKAVSDANSNPQFVLVDDDTSGGCCEDTWRMRTQDTLDYWWVESEHGLDDPLTRPLIIEEFAPDNALRIDASGNVGFKTSSPAEDLHLSDPHPVILFEETDDTQVWRLHADHFGFRIEDGLGAPVPFRIEPGASHDSLRIDEFGRVGFNTGSPTQEIHINSEFPEIRIEDTSDGSWYIKNSNSNRLDFSTATSSPNQFTISGSAPDASLFINGAGKIGMGTDTPQAAQHLRRSDGAARLLVEETSSTTKARELFKLSNNGGPFFIFQNSDLGESYSFAMGATGHFLISHQQTSGVQMRLRPNGDMEIQGSLAESSSRAEKSNIKPVDEKTVLAKLDRLPISEWNYRGDPAERHVSPMAEDFYSTFGLGPDSKHIAPKDLAGVALAAAKALKSKNGRIEEKLQRKNERITELESRNHRLEQRLRAIENRLGMTRR